MLVLFLQSVYGILFAHCLLGVRLVLFRSVIVCEALLRCIDSLGRAVPADKAISVAESAGMIDELTEWVFREALTQRERWSSAGFDLSIAVNLSAHSSFNQDFPELLVRL